MKNMLIILLYNSKIRRRLKKILLIIFALFLNYLVPMNTFLLANMALIVGLNIVMYKTKSSKIIIDLPCLYYNLIKKFFTDYISLLSWLTMVICIFHLPIVMQLFVCIFFKISITFTILNCIDNIITNDNEYKSNIEKIVKFSIRLFFYPIFLEGIVLMDLHKLLNPLPGSNNNNNNPNPNNNNPNPNNNNTFYHNNNNNDDDNNNNNNHHNNQHYYNQPANQNQHNQDYNQQANQNQHNQDYNQQANQNQHYYNQQANQNQHYYNQQANINQRYYDQQEGQTMLGLMNKTEMARNQVHHSDVNLFNNSNEFNGRIFSSQEKQTMVNLLSKDYPNKYSIKTGGEDSMAFTNESSRSVRGDLLVKSRTGSLIEVTWKPSDITRIKQDMWDFIHRRS